MATKATATRHPTGAALPLPVLDCDGCGACCGHVGTPPGFAAFFGDWPEPELRRLRDWATFQAMPEGPRGELRAYYAGVDDGTVEDRALEDAPCLWYDGAARRCRHHEHRPAACRGFEVGGGSCLSFRRAAGLA